MKSFLLIGLSILYFQEVQAASSKVDITWSYQNFPLKIDLFSVRPEKEKYISETNVVNSLLEAPIIKNLNGHLRAEQNASTPAVLVIKNTTDKDQYFFAVPHELNPHHASAGHYFECLCIGRVFKVPAKKTFYRIVRLNLNESFSGLKKFEVNHKIIGISEKEALTTYKDRIRNEN
jgi:hypothetical protein